MVLKLKLFNCEILIWGNLPLGCLGACYIFYIWQWVKIAIIFCNLGVSGFSNGIFLVLSWNVNISCSLSMAYGWQQGGGCNVSIIKCKTMIIVHHQDSLVKQYNIRVLKSVFTLPCMVFTTFLFTQYISKLCLYLGSLATEPKIWVRLWFHSWFT